ncbi:MAG: CorA family divalent cation transporter [Rhodanobacteraceae bacterium]
MLTVVSAQTGKQSGPNLSDSPSDPVWYDLEDPSSDEIQQVESATKLKVPCREQINALGLSNHNRIGQTNLHLHMALYPDGDESPGCSPLGLVISPATLLTVRYAKSMALDRAMKNVHGEPSVCGADAFATLLESLTDDIAEQMQHIATDMTKLSTRVFVEERLDARALRRLILEVGHLERRLTRYRTSQLGMARMLDFVEHRVPEWISAATNLRLKIAGNDLRALDKFDEQLTDKLQFLLDAILGFITTDQNGVMKVLTIASVVTVPPLILAAIWGMNFKHMPDLIPVWAYPAALLAIAISIVVPLLWFRKLGWLTRD